MEIDDENEHIDAAPVDEDEQVDIPNRPPNKRRRHESDSSESSDSAIIGDDAEAARKRRRLENPNIHAFREVDQIALQSEQRTRRKGVTDRADAPLGDHDRRTLRKRSFVPARLNF